MPHNWKNVEKITSIHYQCGYCGKNIASDKGYTCETHPDDECGVIAICHFCSKPTYLDKFKNQYPGIAFGNHVDHIPNKEISELYDEARCCLSVNANTASILCSRKLLIHVAVSEGAEPGLSFKKYLEYLGSKGFIPPGGNEWFNHIHEKGNEPTHEIQLMTREDAGDFLTFIEMLLKFIYEFPTKMNKKQKEDKEPIQRISLVNQVKSIDWDID